MRSLFIHFIALAAASVWAVGTGCTDSDPFTLEDGEGGDGAGNTNGTGAGSSNGGDAAGGGDTHVDDDGAQLFAALEPEFVTNCGACHEPGGIADTPFLALPDRYQSILAWPGIVTSNAGDSLLDTYAITGSGHSGTNLDTIPGDFQARVQAWLEAEAAAIAEPIDDTPHLEPITPIIGFNSIYLNPLDPELEGVAITFNASELTDSTLQLSELQVLTTTATGVHIVHPVFAVYPKDGPGNADPIDSFAGLDAKFVMNTSADLGGGLLFLTNWTVDGKLGIGFEVVEAYSGTEGEGGEGGGSAGGGCGAIAEFDASAKPQFQNRCFTCHGGTNQQATAAVDMSDLMTDSAAACAQIKNRVNPADPPASQIFITTDPQGNAAHPFKFGGDAGQFGTFKNQVSIWIDAE